MNTMKLNKTFMAFSFLLIGLAGCNTENLENDINALKDRVSLMEAQVQALNDNMNILRIALDGNKTIQKCTDNGDGSYTLLLSDGSTLTLTQGVEGSKFYPQISIDGNGYWVIDGVTQDYKAKAEDGKDGQTPLFRLDAEGNKYYWSVSYDNGVTYNPLLDVLGNKVQANAEASITPSDDRPITDVKVSGDCLKFKVDGQDYSIPIVEGLVCQITIPEDSKDGDFCVVSTKAPSVLAIEASGDYCLVNATEGWTASVNEGKNQLTITAPKEADKEGVITLQVNKGINWATEKIKVKSRYIINSYFDAYKNDGMTLNIAGLEVNKDKYPDATLIDNTSDSKVISQAGVYFITSDAENVTINTETSVDKLVLISDTPNKKAKVRFTTSARLESDLANPVYALYGMEIDYTNLTTVDYLVLSGTKPFDIYIDLCNLTMGTRNFVNIKSGENYSLNDFVIKKSLIKYSGSDDISGKHIISVHAKAAATVSINQIIFENNLIYNSMPNHTVTNFCLLNATSITPASINLMNNTLINMQSSYATSNRGFVNCKSLSDVTSHKNIIWFNQKMVNNNYPLFQLTEKPNESSVINVKSNIGFSSNKISEKGGNVTIKLFLDSELAPVVEEELVQLEDDPLDVTDIANGIYTITNDLYKDYGYQK